MFLSGLFFLQKGPVEGFSAEHKLPRTPPREAPSTLTDLSSTLEEITQTQPTSPATLRSSAQQLRQNSPERRNLERTATASPPTSRVHHSPGRFDGSASIKRHERLTQTPDRHGPPAVLISDASLPLRHSPCLPRRDLPVQPHQNLSQGSHDESLHCVSPHPEAVIVTSANDGVHSQQNLLAGLSGGGREEGDMANSRKASLDDRSARNTLTSDTDKHRDRFPETLAVGGSLHNEDYHRIEVSFRRLRAPSPCMSLLRQL